MSISGSWVSLAAPARGLGFLAILFVIPACKDRRTTVINSGNFALSPVPTRADSIASPVTDSWNEPTLQSINPVQGVEIDELRVFRCCDGAGIVAWVERGPSATQRRWIYAAFFDVSGGVLQPVQIVGDFPDSMNRTTVANMVVVWTPAGDAVLAFIAEQSNDPTDLTDVTSDRVYFTSFRRTLATTPLGPSGEVRGFTPTAVAVDTNVTLTDDNDVDTLFAATNLADGTLAFRPSFNTLDQCCTGDKGDSPALIGAPFIFLGWVHDDGNTDRRVEGGFVDLAGLTLGPVSAISPNPAIAPGETIDTPVLTSGRDIVFTWREQSPPNQARVNLARINAAGAALGATVDVARGTATGFISFVNELTLIGDGHRAINGQDTSWIILREVGYGDAGVSQMDEDLLIAQIDASGSVSIDEFDHNSPSAANPNDLVDLQVKIGRGATRAFLFYEQVDDVTGGSNATNDSLFVRALRLDGTKSLTNNVSAEARVNTLVDSDANGDTSVFEIFLERSDPFCSPQCNNDVCCVVFRQELDNDPDSIRVTYGRVAITDITADPIAIAVTETDIFPSIDTGHSANTNFDPVLVPAGTAGGDCIVFLGANGNTIDDDSLASSFSEARPFVFAPALPGGQSISAPIEIGTNAPGGPGVGFADFGVLQSSSFFHAVATSDSPAGRDGAFDDDTACPEFAHVLFHEFLGDPQGGAQGIWRSRGIDLRTGGFAAGQDRLFPDLTAAGPAAVGAGYNGLPFQPLTHFLDTASEGNSLLALFNELTQAGDDPGTLYVNTFDPTARAWSVAALLSNESPGPAVASGIPTSVFSPGVTSGCCPSILGGWVFWRRQTNTGLDLLQGRRLTGVLLQ